MADDSMLHVEYTWVWVAHQLVPFADVLLGIPGVLDQRLLGSGDWLYRLPCVALALLFPRRKAVVAFAHVVNILFCAAGMPSVWDHMVWSALTEATYVAAVLCHGRDASFMRRCFLPAARAVLVTLYVSAAFWKLTTSFLDERTSCANTLVAELAAALFGDELAADGAVARFLMATAGLQILAIEFSVPFLLWASPSAAGVPLALLFHQTINLMPVTYAGGFSVAMGARMVVFAPGVFLDAQRDAASTAKAIALLAFVTAAFLKARTGFDSAGVLFLAFGFFHCKAALFDAKPFPAVMKQTAARGLRVASVLCASVYAFGLPVLGVMAMAGPTMFAGLRQFDGVGGNHLLAPTGLLQTWYRDAPARSWLGDAFGGGTVRLEKEGTDSSVFDELYFAAEITHELPEQARAILARACAGNQGRYFEFYVARNAFNVRKSLPAVTNAAPTLPAVPAFAVPSYELRRALALAKQRGEPFSVTFAHLETRLPTQWRLERPPAHKVLTYAFDGANGSCADANGAACGPDALPNLPPPPAWLASLLHPYPVPLLAGLGDEVHCAT